MFVTKQIESEHKDLIHDVSFDFYGKRMATCSSDQSVKVWDLGEDGEWKCTASWKTHSGSVFRVTWAHPEFGQVLATCSFDRQAAVWEENFGDVSREGVKSNWIKKSILVDSRTAVTDVKFAPKHLGLQLAICCSDGMVRIYECPDVMNISQWSLQHDIQTKFKCSCLSWNSSRMHPPMIAVGSDDNNPSGGGKCQVFEYNDSTRKWTKVETIVAVTDPVHDVAFAPNLGRSYHLLAIASKELKIISLTPLGRDSVIGNQAVVSRFEMKQVASFPDHESPVWRVSWNVTGTVLSSSGDDGCVRLWKANYLGRWKCISIIKGDASQSRFDRNLSANPSQIPIDGVSQQSNEDLMRMNIKRNSGWPSFHTKKDQGKTYY
ncbi:nucleoporin SEH1-like [Saccostrea cucullata]|uniref:nucleoporin SEH1-like n=1 Tax=Saccostrea cuccullata TaxID=36930 RepID=UPI002ED0CCF6